MDFIQGIPVEYELDAFSMPSTDTTSCHPKNWLCRSERKSTLDTLATISPLAHINGDSAYSPQKYQTHKTTQSLTRPTTHAALSTPR